MTVRPSPTPTEPITTRVPGEATTRRRLALTALPDRVWVALLALLALWVAQRMGLFHLWQTVATADGPLRLPDGFAGVDHPFHAARAETLRRALADGHPLRWIGHHQGGYPVEFYPLGVAWLEVGVWALLLGALPMVAVHKLVVGLIFLLPGLAYALMARRDRWPLGVALAALTAHVAVPGAWMHGGYTELVQWGLVTNVAAAVALLFVLLWLTAYLESGHHHHAAGAALAAAFAVSTNPRSLIALATIGLGVWLTFALATRAAADGSSHSNTTRRLALVAALSAALSAPELIALLRFSNLYDFVRYETYENPAAYLRAAIDAVSLPVFTLALVGAVLPQWLPGRPVTRAAATTLALYAAVTLLLATDPTNAPLISQLEAPRLMPFQRLLTIYLAAVALHLLLQTLVDRLVTRRIGARPLTDAIALEGSSLPRKGAGVGVRATLRQRARATPNRPDPNTQLRNPFLLDALLLAASLALLLTFVAPTDAAPPIPGPPAPPPHGLYPVTSTAAPEQAAFLVAIAAADAAAPPGTAILVIGSALSWHQQLSAPLRTERPLFYDDWLWYWHPLHAGTPAYVPGGPHHYPDPEAAFAPDYLARHAIGAVAVTEPQARAAAARSSALTLVLQSEPYDVYATRTPTTVVTFDGANVDTVDLSDHRLVASGMSRGGAALIRRNWHPRWRATVNGRPAPITRTPTGYMSAPVPSGEARIELVYGVDTWDWLARGLSAGGVVALGWSLLGRWPVRRVGAAARSAPGGRSTSP